MGRTRNGLRGFEARGNSYLGRSDCFLPAKPRKLQASQARRVFRNGSAQEQLRQGTEEDSARAVLDTRATPGELTPHCVRRMVDSACNRDSPSFMRTQKPKPRDRKGTEMSKAAGQPSTKALSRVVDLLVESRIRIDAMEQVLVKTNPVAYELYLGTIENLRAQKTAEVKKVLTATLKSKLSEG